MKSRGELKTEQQNPQSSQIDSMSINDILKTINREDQKIAIAVQATIRDIEKTVELTVNSIQKGAPVVGLVYWMHRKFHQPFRHRKDYLLELLPEGKMHCEIPLKVRRIDRKRLL